MIGRMLKKDLNPANGSAQGAQSMSTMAVLCRRIRRRRLLGRNEPTWTQIQAHAPLVSVGFGREREFCLDWCRSLIQLIDVLNILPCCIGRKLGLENPNLGGFLPFLSDRMEI